jgi:hypothetical protein
VFGMGLGWLQGCDLNGWIRMNFVNDDHEEHDRRD